ncbi:glycosyl hydrolase [Georgenia alba]|uniref:Glycosyl hydrolase n=1 Tax=Georgenia alba TaxID=2233858 RepID=A0ABW2Q427_9MICO
MEASIPRPGPEPVTGAAALHAGFVRPDPAARPMTRWWWFGPAVERHRLREELDAIADGGYGGVEVAYVYPLSEETDRLGSPTFLADLRFAAEEARARGLRFDLTLGSGWSFGGPHIDGTTAARRLAWERHEVGPAGLEVPLVGRWPGESLVAAFTGDGSLQELPEHYDRIAHDEEVLRVPAGRGPRVVLLAWSRPTGQIVKRAAAGAEGPVLDHYSARATDTHLERFGEPLLTAVPPELLGSVFCDSLEVYGADWTPDLPAEFARRRGYELLPDLWALAPGERARARDGERPAGDVRADVYATLTELYEENFVARVRAWAHARGVPFRIQNYGEPPASISGYAAADLIEGEGWGWRELTQTRWATSAANLYGADVVSAETWTWVHSPSFRATPLDLKGELHEHLLLGVNQVVAHGWPYSPRTGDGLGWIFYAAGALDDRNPWWPAMPHLLGYTHRLSWLMRQGRRVSEVGIYAPYQDVYARMHEERPHRLDLWHRVREHVGDAVPAAIRDAALDYDVFDDASVEVLDPARFRVVVLPAVSRLPAPTAAWLERARDAGTCVLRLGGSIDLGTPVSDLATALPGLLDPPLRVAAGGDDGAVGVTYRRVGDVDVFFVANTSPHGRTVTLVPRLPRGVVERWDPDTGNVTAVLDGAAELTLELHPYEAVVLVGHDGEPTDRPKLSPPTFATTLDGPWTLRYADEETAHEVVLPHRWEDDPGRHGYSGAATYTTTVHGAPGADRPAVTLDLGPASAVSRAGADRDGVRGRSYRTEVVPPVGAVAEVAVNGRLAGVAWHPPYAVGIGHLLGPGENTLSVTVRNTAANALAGDRSVRDAAALSRERYGRRFAMQDLERAADTVSSGLLAVPTLRTEAGQPS